MITQFEHKGYTVVKKGMFWEVCGIKFSCAIDAVEHIDNLTADVVEW